SGLSGISGDNLGNHTATQALNLSGYPLVNVSSMTLNGLNILGGVFSVMNGTSAAISVQSSNLGVGTLTPGLNATAAYGRIMHVYDNTPGLYPGIFIEDNDIAPGARWFVHSHGDGRNSFAIRDDKNAFEPFYIEGSNVGIGTDDYTPAARLHVSSMSSNSSEYLFMVSTGMPFSPTTALVVRGDGNVGVGSPNPASRLEVAGTVTAVNFVGNGSGLSGISGDNLGSHIAGTALDMAAHPIINVSSMMVSGPVNASSFVGDGSGLSGISGDNLGSHTAAQNLDMANHGIVSVSSMYVTGIVNAGGFSGDGSQLTNVLAGNIPDNISVSTINAAVSTPYGGINITTNTFFSGEVGIGTKWQGGYKVRIDEGDVWGDNPELNLVGVEGSLYLSGPLQASSAAGDWENYILYGKMGVGTSKPGAKFEVIGGSSTFRGLDTHADIAAFGSESGAFKVVISTAGGVGIGTQAPAAKLDVAGNVKIADGTQGAGKVLTSDANGLASWGNVAGDGLGNHVATATLNMAGYQINNVSTLTVTSAVSAAYFSGNGSGLSNVSAAYVPASGVQAGALPANVIASSIAVNSVADNSVLSLSASKLTGALPAINGSALLSVPGDNLGSHVATQALNLAGQPVLNVSSIALNSYAIGASSQALVIAGSSFAVLGNGNLGVGVADPIDLVHMHGGNPWLRISDSDGTKDASIGMANNVLRFDEAGVGNRMALDLDTSRLGIGTLAPGYKLDVQGGSINASGGFCIGGICKASWVEVVAGAPGDNLGNHVATATLNMANFPLINISSIVTVNGGLRISSNTAVAGNGLYITDAGAMYTLGTGFGTYLPAARGTGSVDLQVRRMLGTDNVAAGNYSTIAGGESNKVLAAADHAFIGAGDRNAVTSGQNSAVAGGYLNTMNGSHSFIGGGYQNTVNNAYAAIGGGQYNTAGSQQTTIAGGYTNSIDTFSNAAMIPGGSNNAVTYGNYALAAGFFARSNAAGAFTWTDSQGQPLDNNVADRTVFKNRGGFMVTGSTNTVIDGTLDRGVFITGDGRVGISTGAPAAALDVVAPLGGYAQIWRDASGVVVASMTSSGILTSQVPLGDNLGSHTATMPLNMAGQPIINISSMSTPVFSVSTMTTSGVSGLALNGVVVSTNIIMNSGVPGADNYIAFPFTAGAAIYAKQAVLLNGNNTVIASSTAASAFAVGIAVTSAAPGQTVWVATKGIVTGVVADAAISFGTTVETSVTEGRVKPGTATSGAVIGKALTTAAGAGSTLTILVTPY
ncbi:MAG: beta strand repeat-containing protein, partial [Elusimicrobiales bacterium]